MPNQNYQRPDGGFDGSGYVADQLKGAARQLAPLFRGGQYRGWNQTYGGLPPRSRPAVRPEGTMATLKGKPVQWMQGPDGQMGWQPFATEGEMARAQAVASRPEGAMATLKGKPVQWMQGPDGQMGWQPFATEGEMARAQAGRAVPSTLATLSSPPQRAMLEERNRMLQQAGGPNISQRLVPSETEAEAINAAQGSARQAVAAFRQQSAADPAAPLPELLDARSPAYAQRADIQAWMAANRNAPKGADGLNIVERFEARQRPVAAAASDPVDYAPGGAPTNPWTPADALSPPPERGAVVGEKWYGKTWDGSRWVEPGDPVAQTDLRPEGPVFPVEPAQTFAPGMDFVPQATAQDSNLNFNSPLPEINGAQALRDEQTKALLGRYLVQAGSLNTPTYGK